MSLLDTGFRASALALRPTAVLVVGVALVVLLGVRCVASHSHRPDWLSLAYDIHGADPKTARKLFVFLHGYGGSTSDVDWVIEDLERREGGADVSFIVVAGPFAGGGGRSWGENPAEFAESLERLRALVEKVAGTRAADDVVVSGFSQGAMMAYRLAADGETAKTAVLLSGCRYAGAEAATDPTVRYVFLHGERDSLCPFGAAKALADALQGRELTSEMISFEGDHEIPEVARIEMARVLATP